VTSTFEVIDRKSLIDDFDDDSENGPAICFSNGYIRKMLTLAKANSDDVLLDLGSGWGQTIIVALTEFRVKRAVGVEQLKGRAERSKKRLVRWSANRSDSKKGRWNILNADFKDVLSGKEKRFSLSDATIVFYGLSTSKTELNAIVRAWEGRKGERRLVYYHNCLFPEIMPDGVDHPFLVSKFPFTLTSSNLAWLKKVTGKKASSLEPGKRPSEDELWDEIRHDYRLDSTGPVDEMVSNYKGRLKRVLIGV